MAAGHDQIRDSEQHCHALPVLVQSPAPNVEYLRQHFSHRNGCSTLARADASRLSSASSGPSLPGIFRLLRRTAIFQSI